MWKVWVFGGAASSWDSWASTSTFDADENSLPDLSHFQWLTSKDLEGPITSIHPCTEFPWMGKDRRIMTNSRTPIVSFFGSLSLWPGSWTGFPRSLKERKKLPRLHLLHLPTRESELVVFRIKAMLTTLGTALQERKSDNRFQVIISKDLRTYFADICHPQGIEGRVLNAEKERRFCSFIIGCCRWPVFSGRLCRRSFWVNPKLIPQSCFFVEWSYRVVTNQHQQNRIFQDITVKGHINMELLCLSILPCCCAPFGLAQQRIDLGEALEHLRSEQLEKSSQRVVQTACK